MTTLSHRLERTIVIRAARETVFQFFTDEARWAAWWGAGSTVDAKPGGRLLIRYPDGTEAVGEVLEVRAPAHFAFTYGFVSGKLIPPGGSRVTIRLESAADGTRLHLAHEFADDSIREEFVQGWRYQLALFANVVANEVHAAAADRVDAWFRAWSEPNDEARRAAFTGIAASEIAFRDRFSMTDGLDDLVGHTGAAQRFMPGIRLVRRGDVSHCQGTAVVDWVALKGESEERGRGSNVFVFNAEGRIESVTGFWGR